MLLRMHQPASEGGFSLSEPVADLVQEKLSEEAKGPCLADFCEHCRPLMKQILDDLKELTESPQKPSTITIPPGEAPR